MRTRHPFPVRTGLGALFLFLAQSLALAVPTAAHAHSDTLQVVVTGQREGHVTNEIAWENDGDAIDEAVAVTGVAVATLAGAASGVPLVRRARARRLEPSDGAVEPHRAV